MSPHDTMHGAEGMALTLVDILEPVSLAVDVIGISIILYGFVRGLFAFLRAEIQLLTDREHADTHTARFLLGRYILTGLEFMIVSDIIQSGIRHTLEDLAAVGALVVIRTAIGFFLGKEIAELAEEHEREHGGKPGHAS